MKHIHITHDSYTIRVYADDKHYHEHDDFIAIVSVQALNDKTVFVHGGLGDMGKKIVRDIYKALKNLGYKEALLDRKNKIVKRVL